MTLNQLALIGLALIIPLGVYLVFKKVKLKPQAKKWMRVLLIVLIAAPLIADFAFQGKYKFLFVLIPGFAAMLYAVFNSKIEK